MCYPYIVQYELKNNLLRIIIFLFPKKIYGETKWQIQIC